MKTYSVKQVAKLLNTNPETVRRWIRDDKLNAVQVSKKDGNIITENDLERFLKKTPKYMPVFAASMAAVAPVAGIAVAGGAVGVALATVLQDMKEHDVKVTEDALKTFIQEQIDHTDNIIQQKQTLIDQTNDEIIEMAKKKGQLQYLLEHEDVLINVMENNDMEDE